MTLVFPDIGSSVLSLSSDIGLSVVSVSSDVPEGASVTIGSAGGVGGSGISGGGVGGSVCESPSTKYLPVVVIDPACSSDVRAVVCCDIT